MGEEGWHVFADVTAAKGVASTLSMPIVEGSKVIGGVNLYGGSRRAFEGHHQQLADILGSWAGGAITNADLSFSTRTVAEQAPAVLRDARKLDVAHGLLAEALGFTVDEARQRLRQAAVRAELHPVRLAEVLTSLLDAPEN